jgi:hypothetical protein
MFGFDHRKSRPITCKLLDGVEQGLYDKDNMIRDLLNWLSEDEVNQFARANDLLPDEDDDSTNEDGDPK